jgi:Tol biopolymer transport system component
VRWWLLAGLTACKFTPGAYPSGDARADDARPLDGDLDSPIDAPATCTDRWRAGTIRFGTPVPIDEVNSSDYDRDPFLSLDERTIWFSSGRSGGTNGTVYIAKRLSPTGVFGTVMIDEDFDSPDDDTKLSMTEDGLYAVVGSKRSGSAGVDVWAAQRASINDNWPVPSNASMTTVNSGSDDHDPTVSADGLRLYLAPVEGGQHLAVSTRADRTATFGTPATITELVSGNGEADPSPTSDERVLLFSSNRPGAAGDPDAPNVWYATRPGSTGTFDAPILVPDINTDAAEGDPHLSSDGCRIYFARQVSGASYDIFVATALPP